VHAQLRDPDVLVHEPEGGAAQPPLFTWHSLMSVQLRVPGWLLQVKPLPHPPPAVAHSLMSVQAVPPPPSK
jgi:hypothetical protein